MNPFEKENNIIEKEPYIKEKDSLYISSTDNNFNNIIINKMNESTSKFIFKPYLTSKDKFFLMKN